MTISVLDTSIQLLAERAVFLPDFKLLVLADLHLGKLVHFRKGGLFVPKGGASEDLQLLEELIRQYKPEEVVFLGDLFHSEANSDYQKFSTSISKFPEVRFTLTKGNHDIIPSSLFTQINMQVLEERRLPNKLSLRHQLPKQLDPDCFYLVGHVHPGYLLQGKARQTYRLPCFHKTNQSLTLPAFGKHTGLFIPEYAPADFCFVVLGHQVLQVRP